MKARTLQLIAFVIGMVSFGLAVAGSPSVDDIYRAAQAGHLDQAQSMVQEVIAQHPKSAKAHYVAAEIYAKEGKVGVASSELQTAEQLEPGLPFARPQAVAELRNVIAMTGTVPAAASHAPGSGASFPWGLIVMVVIAVGVIVMVIRALGARNAYRPAYPADTVPGQPYMANGYGQPYGAPSGGGLGSSILGGLATGAAVGAGMVAGEELVHHFIDGDKAASAAEPSFANQAIPDDMGGTDFGMTDTGSWSDGADLSSNDIGGNDWT
jgi:hypothetical protein